MAKTAGWIVTIAIVIILAIVAYNFIKDRALPLIGEGETIERLEEGELTDRSEVIISLDDNRYHRPGCPAIVGTTERSTLLGAENQNVDPCRYCIPVGDR